MPWSAIQQNRLAIEKQLLEAYIGKNRVTWIDPTGDTKVEARLTCSNNKEYTLRIYLPQDFPNSVPPMIVKTTWMTELKKRNGSDLDGHDDHIYGSRDGCTSICHFRPDLWKDDNTLFQIFMKGLMWLEAYEAHLRTGYNLSKYLADMWLAQKDCHDIIRKFHTLTLLQPMITEFFIVSSTIKHGKHVILLFVFLLFFSITLA